MSDHPTNREQPPDSHALRQQMAEIAALPPEHPQRQAVARSIAAAGGEVEREWLDLLRHDEWVRLELARVNIPTDLHTKLLALPEGSAVRGAPARWQRRVWWSAVAAVLVVAVGFVAVRSMGRSPQTETLKHIALLTAGADDDGPATTVDSSDWATVLAAVQPHLPFAPVRPQLSGNVRLIGGSPATLDGRAALRTRWSDGSREFSIYQFCGSDFGLKRPLERTILCPSELMGNGRKHCRVVLWSNGQCDFAMVIEIEGDESSLPA